MSTDCTPQCCPSSYCHDGLLNLPERARLNVTGVEQGSKCLSVYSRQTRGVILYDGFGGAIVTVQPTLPMPYLRNLVLGEDGRPVILPDGNEQEDVPPGIENLIVADKCGKQWRYHGKHGTRQRLIWNGCQWITEPDLGAAELADFPSVDGLDCNYREAALVDMGGGTYALGYRTVKSRNAGEVVMYAGPVSTLPSGWLLCDGSAVSGNVYPDLYQAIGYSWGRSGDLFRLPDMRGRFPRGVDDGADNDPDVLDREALYSGGNTGDSVGSYQSDAFQGHGHDVNNSAAAGPSGGSSDGIQTDTASLDTGTDLLEVTTPIELASGPVRISEETRPKNAGFNFIIYAGCRLAE